MDCFATLEDAVKTKLTAISGIKTLGIYAGQLETGQLDDITIQFPCVYIITTVFDLEYENQMDFVDITMQLIIGDRNLRGFYDAQRGDSLSAGVYPLMQDCYDALHSQKLDGDFNVIRLSSARPLVYRPVDGLCIWAQTYQIKGNL